MPGVGELELESEAGHAVALGLGRARDDVHVVLREHVGDVAEQLRPVERLDLDRDDVGLRGVVVPLDLDDPVDLREQARAVGAVGPVDRHTTAAGDEAHDLVAGYRGAAPGEAHEDVVEALDVHPDRGAAALDRATDPSR